MIDGLVGLEGIKRNNWAATVTPYVKEVTGQEAQSFKEWAKENASKFQ